MLFFSRTLLLCFVLNVPSMSTIYGIVDCLKVLKSSIYKYISQCIIQIFCTILLYYLTTNALLQHLWQIYKELLGEQYLVEVNTILTCHLLRIDKKKNIKTNYDREVLFLRIPVLYVQQSHTTVAFHVCKQDSFHCLIQYSYFRNRTTPELDSILDNLEREFTYSFKCSVNCTVHCLLSHMKT